MEAPAQQRIPPQAKVRTFPVVERHRWLWIWMGDAEAADPSLIPDTHWLDDPARRSLDGYIHYDVNYLLIADNLLDFSHLPFVHPTTLGGSEDYASAAAGGAAGGRRAHHALDPRHRGAAVCRAGEAVAGQGRPLEYLQLHAARHPGDGFMAPPAPARRKGTAWMRPSSG